MNENRKRKIIISKPVINMLVSGVVLFLCAFSFTPQAGILRTVPLFFFGGAVCCLFSSTIGMTAALSAVMTLCMYLAMGRSVGETVIFAVASCLLSMSGMYAVKFIRAARKTQKKTVRKKCAASAAAAAVVSILLSLVLCGNVFSFIKHDLENSRRLEYVNEHLGKKPAEKKFTSYDFSSGEYRTYVRFEDNGVFVGAEDDCYISKKNGVLTDNIRDYYESKLLVTAENVIANAVSKATWGYNITASDIAFTDAEVLSSQSEPDDYMDRVRYVVSFESLFDETDKERFASICRDTVSAIISADAEFEKIVLCGGSASQVIFSLTVTPDMTEKDVYNKIVPFDAKQVEDIGVSEMTILDYWKNK